MNQNLLIVDDEQEILTWLKELFSDEFDQELGVYTAGSALEAVKLLAKVRFDVVLTDIRMPGMDGITLFRHIKENWPRCKTVFLTGYGNFEDIYQVINHEDVRYVLKSEDDDVIVGAVRQMLEQSRRELEAEKSRKEQESWFAEAKYWLRRELMNQLCSGEIPDHLDERLTALEIPIREEKPVLPFLLRIEREWKDVRLQERMLKEEALNHMLHENIPSKLCFYCHIMDNDQELLLLQPANGEQDWQLISVIVQGAVEYVQEQFRNLYHDTVSGVLAAEPVGLRELAQCLRKLKTVMVGYVGGAREVILRAETVSDGASQAETSGDSAGWAASLRNLMELGKKKEYFELLGRYLQRMTAGASRHDAALLEIYYSVSIFLLQFINENHLNEAMAFRLGLYKLTMAEEHKDWLEAAAYLTEVSEAVFSLLADNESSLADHALKRVVSYIEDHLDEDLSLTTLADVGGFNASYLSRLFKQVQKETVSDFILHKRIHLAKQLLADPSVKIQDVAARSGYLSPHSFTRAFRNEVGISPTEYRELRLGTYPKDMP